MSMTSRPQFHSLHKAHLDNPRLEPRLLPGETGEDCLSYGTNIHRTVNIIYLN
jgi:hypothetical protein